ncbi:MAG: 30S ribosomal protein S8 [Patescibacteria group bacterium]|nr:30S ribosomal protein S8 [Patescibacteria group bacterium]
MYIDLLIKIKNAQAAGKKSLKTRYVKIDYAVAELLQRSGFLKKVEVKGKSLKKIIEIHMNPERPIQGLKLLSRPSMRQYRGYRDFRKVKGGYGLLVVSTPKGILTGEQARKDKTGGQMLFEVW